MHNRCHQRFIFIFFSLKIFFYFFLFKIICPIQEDCFFYVEGSDVMTLGGLCGHHLPFGILGRVVLGCLSGFWPYPDHSRICPYYRPFFRDRSWLLGVCLGQNTCQ